MKQFASAIIYFFMLTTLVAYPQVYQGTVLQWKIAGMLPASGGQVNAIGVAGPVVGIHHDRLVVGGGANFPGVMPWEGGTKKYYDEAFVYWKQKNALVRMNKSYKLPKAIAYSANCSTPKGIVYAGGENESGISKNVRLLEWDIKKGSLVVSELPDLPLALTNAMIASHGNVLYLAGGETTTGVSDKFYSLNLDDVENGWKELPPLPKPISHAVMVFDASGDHQSFYLLGGRMKHAGGISEIYSTVYQFDLDTQVWRQRASMPHGLSAGTGIATGAGTIVTFGGDKGDTFNKVESLIAAINSENDKSRQLNLVQQKNKLQMSHPGFDKQVLVYNTIKDSWRLLDSIPFAVPVTTTACKWKDKIIIPGGEIRAGVRTPQILMAEWKRGK